MKTYRIYREVSKVDGRYTWLAYHVNLLHLMFGPPFGYVVGSLSLNSAEDCENNLRRSVATVPAIVEREVKL